MSDPKVEGPNSDPVSGINVDSLLAEVKQMADRVENLIGTSKSSKPPARPESALQKATSPESQSQPLASPADAQQAAEDLPAESPTAAEPVIEESKISLTSEPAPMADESDVQIGESASDIHVDSNTDKLADDEISSVLERIDKKKQAEKEERAAQEHQALVAQSMPQAFKTLLVALMTVDRLFLWVPRPVKDILGYAGISTLLLAIILWIMILITGS